jgi:hypothetical protein
MCKIFLRDHRNCQRLPPFCRHKTAERIPASSNALTLFALLGFSKKRGSPVTLIMVNYEW